MDRFNNHPRGRPGQRAIKETQADGTTDSELNILNEDRGGNAQPLTELSPQERPQFLDEWGRHGSRGNELSSGQDAHGISELDGTSVNR